MSGEHRRPKFLPRSGDGYPRLRTKQDERAAHEQYLRDHAAKRGRR